MSFGDFPFTILGVTPWMEPAEDAFVKAMDGFDAIIVRCNPGQINAAGGGRSGNGLETDWNVWMVGE